jgi:hypothetical protein
VVHLHTHQRMRRQHHQKILLKVDVVTPLGLAFIGKVISHSAGGGQGEAALLQWTDPTAKDVDTYTLQRSPAVGGGRNFATINKNKAKPNQQEYNYTDGAFATFANANNGKAFYRLLQQNKDGKENYSNTVLLTTANSPLTITPNPASDKVKLTFSKTSRNSELTVVDSKGAVVYRQSVTGRNSTISTSNWTNGTYTLTLTYETGKQESRQLVVQHP